MMAFEQIEFELTTNLEKLNENPFFDRSICIAFARL